MSNSKKIILIAAGIGAFFYYIVDAVKRLKWRLKSVNFASITQQSIILQAVFQLYNSTIIQLKIGNLDADVYFNDTKIGNINYNINRYLLRRSVNTFHVNVEIFYNTIPEALYNQIMQGSLTNWALRIDGKLEVNEHKISVDKTFYIEDFKVKK